MKKLALTLLALSSAAVLASCGNKPQTVTPNTPTQAKQSFKSMAQDSALSSISMLNSGATGKQLRRAALTDAEKETVLKQLDLVDELLKGDSIKSEEVAVPEGDEYHGTYDKYYTLTVNQIDGTKEEYKFYYKETLIPNEEEKPEAKAAENQAAPEADPNKQEPVEEEVSSDLDGVVIIGDKTYKMHGDKEVTKEGQEVEVEFSFVITEEGTKNRVVVKQETETGAGENENEYSYTRFDEKGMVEKVKIDFEQENGETEYSVRNMTKDSKTSYKFKFEDKDGKTYVRVKIVENNNTINAKLEYVDGKYVFIE